MGAIIQHANGRIRPLDGRRRPTMTHDRRSFSSDEADGRRSSFDDARGCRSSSDEDGRRSKLFVCSIGYGGLVFWLFLAFDRTEIGCGDVSPLQPSRQRSENGQTRGQASTTFRVLCCLPFHLACRRPPPHPPISSHFGRVMCQQTHQQHAKYGRGEAAVLTG